jgi:hypothetical protein
MNIFALSYQGSPVLSALFLLSCSERALKRMPSEFSGGGGAYVENNTSRYNQPLRFFFFKNSLGQKTIISTKLFQRQDKKKWIKK